MEKKNKTLIEEYHQACDALAERVNEHLFQGARDWYWVGNDTGGIRDFGDTDFLRAEDMVRVLDHHLSYYKYSEWRDANIDNLDTKGYINLRSWLMGCRHSMLADKPKKAE